MFHPLAEKNLTTTNGLSDSDVETDTESLPEAVHSKSNVVDSTSWQLRQKCNEEIEGSTDESELEGPEEDTKVKRKKEKKSEKFDLGFPSSTVEIKSRSGQRKLVERDHNRESYNVEEEILTVSYSKKDTENVKMSLPISPENFREVKARTPVKEAPEESEEDEDDPVTYNDLVQVSFEDFKEIIDNEVEKNSAVQELKSYESCISQREQFDDVNNQVDLEASEEEENSTSDQQKVPEADNADNSADEADDDDPSTEISGLDVPMIDYYKIRHQTDTPEKLGSTAVNVAASRFDSQQFFQSIAKTSTRITSAGQEDDPLTDEDESATFDDDKVDDEKSDDEDDVTKHSDVQVNMRDYYVIRKENTRDDVNDEYVLMLNQVQSLVRMSSVDKNDPSSLQKRDFSEITESIFELTKPNTDSDNEQTDDEQIVCDKFDDDKDETDDNYQIETSGTKSCVDVKSKFLTHFHCVGDGSKLSSEEVSMSDVLPKPRSIPIIRLVEMEGFQAAVGVACLDPLSPTRDEVHGIKFIERNDGTEEISAASDLDDQASLAECGHHSPATEDEAISEFELDSAKNKEEYSLPPARCKIYYTKVKADGRSTTMEENLNPTENLSLVQFMKEIENVSECDVVLMTDDEVEDLPSDYVTSDKTKIGVPLHHLSVSPKRVNSAKGATASVTEKQKSNSKKKRGIHNKAAKKSKNIADNR